MPPDNQTTLRDLRDAIVQHFSEEEVKNLCFDLNIDYDSVSGEGKPGKIRELLQVLQRSDRIPELFSTLKRLRVGEGWVDELKASSGGFYQEKAYNDNNDAFLDAGKHIYEHLEWCIRNEIDNPRIDLKIIAVAMTFSWRFINVDIPKILRQYTTATVNLQALFIDHEFLATLPLANYDVDWAKESEFRTNQVQRFAVTGSKRFGNRLLMVAKTYKNLPHWHGVLVNDEHLFLGRTNWLFPDGKPELTVGQNKYRYFNTSSPKGSERVELFKNWHKYYFDFVSTQICSTLFVHSESDSNISIDESSRAPQSPLEEESTEPPLAKLPSANAQKRKTGQ